MLFRSYAWKGYTMRKITGLILILCLLITSAGCSTAPDTTGESTASTTTQATEDTESTSDTTVTSQTEQTAQSTTAESTAPDDVAQILPADEDSQILELKSTILYDYAWSAEYEVPLAECECTSILLSEKDAERYPELSAVLKATADADESYFSEEFAMLKEAAEELLAEGTELAEPLGSVYDAQVRRADSTVLSILTDCTYNNGMNGGNRSFWGSNYDTATGNELHLPDIVTDMSAFADVVEEKLFSTVGKDVFYNENIIDEYFEMYGADGTHWTIDYNGVTVYFGEGEIADIGVGGMNVTVTFAENAELFNEKYTDVPKAYIVSLPTKTIFSTDLDGDGDCEELSIYDYYDEDNDYYATIDIYTDKDTATESFWAYACEPYYVKTADGMHYLYIFAELETQMYLYAYEVTGGQISRVGEASVSPYYNDGLSAVLTDPYNMHFDIFSEESGGGVPEGNDLLSVGADGLPALG